MSTNYYFKDKKENKTIHIGKTVVGGPPVFRSSKYFTSVKEIKSFYEGNEKDLSIVDEYNNEFTLKDLETRLLNFNKCQHINTRFYEEFSKSYKDPDGNWFLTVPFS